MEIEDKGSVEEKSVYTCVHLMDPVGKRGIEVVRQFVEMASQKRKQTKDKLILTLECPFSENEYTLEFKDPSNVKCPFNKCKREDGTVCTMCGLWVDSLHCSGCHWCGGNYCPPFSKPRHCENCFPFQKIPFKDCMIEMCIDAFIDVNAKGGGLYCCIDCKYFFDLNEKRSSKNYDEWIKDHQGCFCSADIRLKLYHLEENSGCAWNSTWELLYGEESEEED